MENHFAVVKFDKDNSWTVIKIRDPSLRINPQNPDLVKVNYEGTLWTGEIKFRGSESFCERMAKDSNDLTEDSRIHEQSNEVVTKKRKRDQINDEQLSDPRANKRKEDDKIERAIRTYNYDQLFFHSSQISENESSFVDGLSKGSIKDALFNELNEIFSFKFEKLEKKIDLLEMKLNKKKKEDQNLEDSPTKELVLI